MNFFLKAKEHNLERLHLFTVWIIFYNIFVEQFSFPEKALTFTSL